MTVQRISLPLTFRGRGVEVPTHSGLNWGQRSVNGVRRNGNEAYVNVTAEAFRREFFPPPRTPFEVQTDDGISLRLHITGSPPKNLQTVGDLTILGTYFRLRLGVPSGDLVTIQHLNEYGRLSVEFEEDDGEYFMNFASPRRFTPLVTPSSNAVAISGSRTSPFEGANSLLSEKGDALENAIALLRKMGSSQSETPEDWGQVFEWLDGRRRLSSPTVPSENEGDNRTSKFDEYLQGGKGQGFSADAEKNTAIEKYAMKRAAAEMTRRGWVNIVDTSSSRPYDFTALTPDGLVYVEVKGTTGSAKTIFLTKNEIENVKSNSPNTALIVVRGIRLSGIEPVSGSGEVVVVYPWKIEEEALLALQFQYSTESHF